MNEPYFFYVGNAYPHKNLNRLIDAIKVINVKLKIVSGRSVFVERLQREIAYKKASKLVEVLGYVSDDELNNLYKNSIAFVFPTLAEGFGIPPMEAINAGILVVQSNIPVLKEVYKDSAIYFDPLDINSITSTLNSVLNMSKTERKERIEYSQEFVKRYSWSKMAKETLKVYESVV